MAKDEKKMRRGPKGAPARRNRSLTGAAASALRRAKPGEIEAMRKAAGSGRKSLSKAVLAGLRKAKSGKNEKTTAQLKAAEAKAGRARRDKRRTREAATLAAFKKKHGRAPSAKQIAEFRAREAGGRTGRTTTTRKRVSAGSGGARGKSERAALAAFRKKHGRDPSASTIARFRAANRRK